MNTREYNPRETPKRNWTKRLETPCAIFAISAALVATVATVSTIRCYLEKTEEPTQEYYEPRTLDNNRF